MVRSHLLIRGGVEKGIEQLDVQAHSSHACEAVNVVLDDRVAGLGLKKWAARGG